MRSDSSSAAWPQRRGIRWHLFENWANEWHIGPWVLAVEWVPKARSFDFWLYDSRMESNG